MYREGWQNAAMDQKPDTVVPQRLRRHWYQFSLPTLLIVVPVIAAPLSWLGSQVRLVNARQAARRDFLHCDIVSLRERQMATMWPSIDDPPEIPWIRRFMGDETIAAIVIGRKTTENEIEKLHELFPEAVLSDNRRSD
jgi:hypothetical protein